MVKRTVSLVPRMPSFFFADPARPATLPVPFYEACNMERELAVLVEAVQKAGARVRELVLVGFEVQTKQDRSPVTTVDHEVNRILHEMQRREFPQDGWLSEESPDDPARLINRRVWIVDPIDGTKALVNRMPEFCISAALTERGAPIVAAILNPSTDELFTAVRGGRLFLNGARVTPHPAMTSIPSLWSVRGNSGAAGGRRSPRLLGAAPCTPLPTPCPWSPPVASKRLSPSSRKTNGILRLESCSSKKVAAPSTTRWEIPSSSISRYQSFTASSLSPPQPTKICAPTSRPMPHRPACIQNRNQTLRDHRSVRQAAQAAGKRRRYQNRFSHS